MGFNSNYPRKCILCGKDFIAKHNRRKICYEDHYSICEICGKSFVYNLAASRRTCSEECRRKSISKNSTSGEKKYERVCRSCGKIYYSCIKNPDQDLGLCEAVHTKICEYCGKLYLVDNKYLYDRKKTCSEECRYKLSVRTWHEHEEENLQHCRDALQAKYGVDTVSQIPGVLEKRQQTCVERYGVPSYTSSQEFKDRMIQMNREKYGVDWYMLTPEYWEKTRATWKEKYGVDNPSKSAEVISGFVNDPAKIDVLMEFRGDPRKFVESRFGDNLPTLQDLAELCGVRDSSIGWILDQTNNRDLVTYAYSYMEREVFDFLSELVPSTTIERNTFKIITPYELDIYLPEYNFAIECNPTSTHNSTSTVWANQENHLDKHYHQMKTDLCDQKEIFLFHLFGHEWVHKKDICKSMIRNILGKTENKVYARKCKVIKVSFADANRFLNQNHRQGATVSSIRLGLEYNGELVSLMTFGKMRNSIGTGKEDLSDCYELSRFCNKINTSVIGGASRLFKYFLKVYHPVRVRSFSDRAHTRGSLYQTLGFQEVNRSDAGYAWVDLKTDVAYSRLNAQKQNIKNFLKDNNIDLSKTEVEIMIEHGFVQVYDSGTITWEYRYNCKEEE